jgi:hypothetical protein
MKETTISQDEAVQIMRLWQEERRPAEVRLRFSQGLIQTHPGYVMVEPEGKVVIAHVVSKNHFLTTVLDLFAFDSIKLIESGNAITFAEPVDSPDTFRSVTIACRQE